MRRLLILGALLLAAIGARGQEAIPAPMKPARLVNDFAGLLTASEQAALEERLVEFDKQTSTQIAVVTLADLGGYDAVDFAQRLHEKWGVGGERDNGIVVLVKPKTDEESGQAAISVGYGLEGVVPDITAGRIIDNEMLPAFRRGEIYKGIDQAVEVLMQLTRGEFTAHHYNRQEDISPKWVGIGVLVVVLIVLALLRGSRGGPRVRGGGWIPPVIGGFGGGGGGFSGGGGFGGFGGGSAGGGGAGRSW